MDHSYRFFKRLLRNHGGQTRKIVTEKLRSYGVAHWYLILEDVDFREGYANHRAEHSHEVTSVSELGMRRFKSMKPAQRFVTVHAMESGCGLMSSGDFRRPAWVNLSGPSRARRKR